jgi:hypothetical protein
MQRFIGARLLHSVILQVEISFIRARIPGHLAGPVSLHARRETRASYRG